MGLGGLLRAGKGLVGLACRSGQPLSLGDPFGHHLFDHELDGGNPTKFGCRPPAARRRVTGVV